MSQSPIALAAPSQALHAKRGKSLVAILVALVARWSAHAGAETREDVVFFFM